MAEGTRNANKTIKEKGIRTGVPKRYPGKITGKLYNIVKMARDRAQKNGLEFDLDVPYLISLCENQDYCCLLTGLKFSFASPENGWRTSPFSPSIDRIDSKMGYKKDNVRLVLWGINLALGEWGEETYSIMALAYCKNQGGDSEIQDHTR